LVDCFHGGTVSNRTPDGDFTLIAGLYAGTPSSQSAFDGWYKNAAEWDFSTPIIEDITLTARWSFSLPIDGIAANDIAGAVAYVNNNPAVYTLLVNNNINFASQNITGAGVELTLEGLNPVTIGPSSANSLFTVSGGAEFILERNITLAGVSGNNGALVQAAPGGTFTMKSGNISGNTVTGNYAAGVFVNGGTFKMSGGSVSGNTGPLGDVLVANNSSSGLLSLSGNADIDTLTLSAGANGSAAAEIASGWSGNITNLNLHGSNGTIDSVISLWKDKIVLKGNWLSAGNIEDINSKLWNFIDADGNTRRINAPNPPDAPYGYMIADSGPDIGKLVVRTFDIYTEVQRYAEAAENMEIIVPNNIVIPETLTIPMPGAAGITLTIKSKGTACSLTRDFEDTYASNGLFVVPSGTRLAFENIVIDGNRTTHTGNAAPLVRVSGGEFTMNAGAVLQNNRATNGGGVYVSYGTFTMNGGEIKNNTAAGSGGGVYISGGTFNVGGTAKVYGNTKTDNVTKSNAYLAGERYITLGAAFNVPAQGMEIHARTERADGMIVSSGANGTIQAYFHADEDGKEVYVLGERLIITRALTEAELNFYTAVENYRTASDNMTITVPQDITLPIAMTIPVPQTAGITLTIKGDTATRKISRGFEDTNTSGGLFIVPSGVNLIFEDIVIDGNKGVYTNNAASLVRVNGGTITMNGGAVLQNNRASQGGGVFVNYGIFIMNGGKVSGNTVSDGYNNYGGGVYVSGTFIMNGGEISGNTVNGSYNNYGGGVYVNGTFTMSGGTISGNTASGTASGSYYSYGGGVYVSSGTFTMSGGAINGNNASGSNNNNYGGGVYVFGGTFNMYGGAISGN